MGCRPETSPRFGPRTPFMPSVGRHITGRRIIPACRRRSSEGSSWGQGGAEWDSPKHRLKYERHSKNIINPLPSRGQQ